MRFPLRASRLERLDFVEFPQRKGYIVKTLEQSPSSVIVNLERQHRRSRGDISILKIGSDFQEPRAISGHDDQNFRNLVAALDRWRGLEIGPF